MLIIESNMILTKFIVHLERTRDKKLRQNRQLRKSMLPKNALMALNEVKGINISDFTINSNPDGGFTAIVTVNTRQYEGKGQSKMAAKNLACEKALRDYIIAKMTPKPKKAPKPANDNESEAMETNDTENTENPPEDDVPMLNLASFAIYKLFAEWEREGYVVPEMHPSAANASAQQGDPNSPASSVIVTPKEPKKPPVRTELPVNWATMHPATLLCVVSVPEFNSNGQVIFYYLNLFDRCVQDFRILTMAAPERSRMFCSVWASLWTIRSSPPLDVPKR